MHDVIIAFCLLLLSTVRTKRFGICVGLFYPASKKLHKLHTESSSDFMLHFSSDGGILSEYEQPEFERFVTELKLRAIHFNTPTLARCGHSRCLRACMGEHEIDASKIHVRYLIQLTIVQLSCLQQCECQETRTHY